MTTSVLTTTVFENWLADQPAQIQKQVAVVVELLRQYGLVLPAPYSSAIVGAAFALRELRPAAGKSPARVFYAFDPERMAVVLCGGSKNDSGDLYETAKALALSEWTRHLAALAARKKSMEQSKPKPRRPR